ncbi:hypothetical protein LguiA_034516 [Lonicera macranthoides]
MRPRHFESGRGAPVRTPTIVARALAVGDCSGDQWITFIFQVVRTNDELEAHRRCGGTVFIRVTRENVAEMQRFIQQSSKSVLSFVSEKTPDVTINIDVPFFTDKNLELLGPCNGIICLSWNGDILLCNPATREFKALPPCINNYLPGLLINELGVGFGFDQHSNDYKVVRIVELFYDDPFIHHDVKAELYKLSTDSWRPLNADVPYVWHQPCFTPFFNGSFHWYAQKDEFQYDTTPKYSDCHGLKP